MKKNLKRAFTIIELTVVLVIVAVLCSVFIPTFISVYNNALTSSDLQTLNAANQILSIEGVANKNCDIADIERVLTKYGYVLSASKNTKNVVAYDQNSNSFVYLNENGEVIYCAQNYDKTSHELWVVCNELTADTLSAGNNRYLTDNFSISGDLDIKGGLYVANGKALSVSGNIFIHKTAAVTGNLLGDTYHTLSLNGVCVNSGEVVINQAYSFVKCGETVTVVADSLKQLTAVSVTSAAVDITDNGDGSFSFIMPQSHLSVTGCYDLEADVPKEGEENGNNSGDSTDEEDKPNLGGEQDEHLLGYTLSYQFFTNESTPSSLTSYYWYTNETTDKTGSYKNALKQNCVLCVYLTSDQKKLLVELNEEKICEFAVKVKRGEQNTIVKFKSIFFIQGDLKTQITSEKSYFTITENVSLLIEY